MLQDIIGFTQEETQLIYAARFLLCPKWQGRMLPSKSMPVPYVWLLQAETMNYTSGQGGKYKSSTYPQPFPRSLTSCRKKFPLTELGKTTGGKNNTALAPLSGQDDEIRMKHKQLFFSLLFLLPLFLPSCASTHPRSYRHKFWFCLLITECKDKNVRFVPKEHAIGG